MLIKLNGVEVTPPETSDGELGYRWFVRVAGYNPYSDPRPTLTCTFPSGAIADVGFGDKAPLLEGAEYTVTAAV